MKKPTPSPVCQTIATLLQTLNHVDTDAIQAVIDQEPSQPLRVLYLYLTFTNATLGQIEYIKRTVRVSPGDFEGEAEVRTATLAHRFMCVSNGTEENRADFLHNVGTSNTLVRQAFVLEAQERNFYNKFRSKAARALLAAIIALD